MKTIYHEEKIIPAYTETVYTYEELSASAKRAARESILDKDCYFRSDLFYEDVKNNLEALFPNCELDVEYSLSYCQGDGLNIYGKLFLPDFIQYWTASDGDKETITKYLHYPVDTIELSENGRYGYSCKFLDRQHADDVIDNIIDDVQEYGDVETVNTELVREFIIAAYDYFEKLDKEYEEAGYRYIWLDDEEIMEEECDNCGYYFNEDGTLYDEWRNVQ